MSTLRTCSKCGEAKPITAYRQCKGYADGYYRQCEACRYPAVIAWQRRNKDYFRNWDIQNIEKRRAARRKWQRKFYQNRSPIDKLHDAIRTKLCRQLRAKKGRRSTVALLGYPIADLKAHLESLFKPGMSWDNYGEWHIDHVRPKVSFNITSPDDPAFRECWAISNLQPLWAVENLTKQGKWEQAA